MSITKTLVAGAAGVFLASSVAAAGEPMKLSNAELDQVSAGGLFAAVMENFGSSYLGAAGSVNERDSIEGFGKLAVDEPTKFSDEAFAKAFSRTTGTVSGAILDGVPFEGTMTIGAAFGLASVEATGN